MKIYVVIAAIIGITCSPLCAGTAADLAAVLRSGAVSYAQAARFVLPAAGIAPDAVMPRTAFNIAQKAGLLPKNASADAQATMGGVSVLVMKAFKLRGGLMWRLTSSPRYAYRELLYLKIIQGRADSGMKVSGERLMLLLGRVLTYIEDGSLE